MDDEFNMGIADVAVLILVTSMNPACLLFMLAEMEFSGSASMAMSALPCTRSARPCECCWAAP